MSAARCPRTTVEKNLAFDAAVASEALGVSVSLADLYRTFEA